MGTIYGVVLPLERGRHHVAFRSESGNLGHVRRASRHLGRVVLQIDVLASVEDKRLRRHTAKHQNFEGVGAEWHASNWCRLGELRAVLHEQPLPLDRRKALDAALDRPRVHVAED